MYNIYKYNNVYSPSSDNEIKVLEKGLDFAPTQRKINEPELRSDFGEFCHGTRIKWHFVMKRH